jgi:predicted anti-sigma-YlaC factor YlaD
MKCEQIRERMPEVAAEFDQFTADESNHLESCTACADELKALRSTMAVLDEWQTPEPSPYFDVRLQARLREEIAKPQAGWLQWFRRPVLAAALTVLMGVGVGLFMMRTGGIYNPTTDNSLSSNLTVPERGSAVSDLQDLEQNQDLYSSFELLDDMDLQQDVVANP